METSTPQAPNHDSDGSANEELTRYLLGEMSEAEQTQLEVRYFANAQLFAELCACRNDLIDNYVSGALSGAMRERFEAAIEKSWAMNERIRFAETLQEALNSRGPNKVAPPAIAGRSPWRSLPRNYRYAVPATALLLLLLLGGALWLRHRQSERSANSSGVDAQASTPDSIEKGGAVNPSRNNEAAAPTQSSPPPNSAAVVTIALTSDPVRSAGSHGRELLISNDKTIIQLRLVVRPPQQHEYFAVLKTPNEFEISKNNQLPALPNSDGTTVDLFLPAERMPDGDYIVRLSALTSDDKVVNAGDYYFRVRKSE